MQAVASLGGNPIGPDAEVSIRDAGTTEASAVAAALAEVEAGSKMLLGPLFSGQCRAVAMAVGPDIPVIGLTNDAEIAGGNLFVFGITATQSARTILGFASSRAVRRVVVVVPPGEFGLRQIEAAQAVAPAFGITLGTAVVTESASNLGEQIREAAGGSLPDGVYLPVVSGPFEAAAQAIGATGVQILGSAQWSAIEPFRINGLRDAWFAAPDPIRFEAFAIALEEIVEKEAGIVAGLAFDAVEMARLLGRLGQQDRDGLVREAGFDGVLGPYRLLPSGHCERGLAVLNVVDGATTLIGSAAV